jgi:hypothetical protein
MGRFLNSSALVAAVLVISGGAYALGSTSAATITACVSHRGGTLYRARTCRANDKTITWNQQGPIGPRGLRGLSGPPGPGATSFATTINQGSNRTLAKLANGVTLAGTCFNNGGIVELDLGVASGGTLQVSGTDSTGGTPNNADFDGGPGGGIGLQSTTSVDWDVIARDGTLNRGFARIDAHAEFGNPCTFWAMITPSSLS